MYYFKNGWDLWHFIPLRESIVFHFSLNPFSRQSLIKHFFYAIIKFVTGYIHFSFRVFNFNVFEYLTMPTHYLRTIAVKFFKMLSTENLFLKKKLMRRFWTLEAMEFSSSLYYNFSKLCDNIHELIWISYFPKIFFSKRWQQH